MEQKLSSRASNSGRRLAINFMLLSGGEMVAKVGGFLAFTHLGRTLGPERYGSIEFAIALMVFFSLPVSFGLDEYGARELARKQDDPMLLAAEIGVARVLMAVFSVVVLLLLIAWRPWPAEEKALLATFGASLMILPALAQWFFQGHDLMGWVGLLSLVRQTAFAVLVLWLFNPARPLYQVGVFECGAVLTAVSAGVIGLRRHFRFSLPLSRVSLQRVLLHLKMSLPIGLSQLTWACLWYSGTLILRFRSHAEDLADFGVAHRMTLALHTFVWLYFVNLLPSISRTAMVSDRRQPVRDLLASSMRAASWAGFFIALMGIVLAKILVELAYGPLFTGASAVLEPLMLIIPAALVMGHFRYTLVAAGLQDWLMRWSLVAGAATIATALLLVPTFGAKGAAWGLLVGTLVQLLLTYFTVQRRVVAFPFFKYWFPSAAAFASSMLLHVKIRPLGPVLATVVPCLAYIAVLAGVERKWIAFQWAHLRQQESAS